MSRVFTALVYTTRKGIIRPCGTAVQPSKEAMILFCQVAALF